MVKYLFPAPEEHGHWVLPKDEAPRVTNMLMKPAQLPISEEKWLALEKETVDALVMEDEGEVSDQKDPKGKRRRSGKK